MGENEAKIDVSKMNSSKGSNSYSHNFEFAWCIMFDQKIVVASLTYDVMYYDTLHPLLWPHAPPGIL